MNTKFSPSVQAGLVPFSKQRSVIDQGPGRTLFVGTEEECNAFVLTLEPAIAMWCKVL